MTLEENAVRTTVAWLDFLFRGLFPRSSLGFFAIFEKLNVLFFCLNSLNKIRPNAPGQNKRFLNLIISMFYQQTKNAQLQADVFSWHTQDQFKRNCVVHIYLRFLWNRDDFVSVVVWLSDRKRDTRAIVIWWWYSCRNIWGEFSFLWLAIKRSVPSLSFL